MRRNGNALGSMLPLIGKASAKGPPGRLFQLRRHGRIALGVNILTPCHPRWVRLTPLVAGGLDWPCGSRVRGLSGKRSSLPYVGRDRVGGRNKARSRSCNRSSLPLRGEGRGGGSQQGAEPFL